MNGISRFLLVISALFLSQVASAATKPLLVLVPGFFNIPGMIPGAIPVDYNYFSDAVRSSLQEEGFEVVVIKNLDPFGSMANNGRTLRLDFEDIAKAHPNEQISVIAHSAGGLYTAQALTENPSLPVRTVITLSTPYAGAELADLVKSLPGSEEIARQLNLTNLREFETKRIGFVTNGLRVPKRVRWVSLAAQQEVCENLTCFHPQYMSWVMSHVWKNTKHVGDGVVSVKSSTRPVLNAREGGVKKMEVWNDLPVQLDHWEIVSEADLFQLFGILNTQWISDQQSALFHELGRRLRSTL